MISEKQLLALGFTRREVPDPITNDRSIYYRKPLIEIFQQETYDEKTGKYTLRQQTVFIKIPDGVPWENEYPLNNIKDITKLEQLDKLLHT